MFSIRLFCFFNRLAHFAAVFNVLWISMANAEGIIPPKVVDTIVIGSGAGTTYTAVNQNRHRLYVANAQNSTVTVVDSQTDAIIDTIAIDSSFNIPSGFVSGPEQILVDEDEQRLYVLTNNGTISVVDENTLQVVDKFVFDSDAGGFEGLVTANMVFSKLTGKLYVQNDNFRIDIIDLRRQKVIGYIYDDQVGPLAIDQRTNRIYTSNAWDGTVWVIDGYADKVIDKIPGVGIAAEPANCYLTGDNCTVNPSFLVGVAVDETLDRLYVAGEDGRVVVIDTQRDRILQTYTNIPAFNLTVDPRTHAVYVIDDLSATLSVIDGLKNELIATNISVGEGLSMPTFTLPQTVTVNPANGKIYVSDFGFSGPDQVVVLQSYPTETND
jgi:YVTN family beta-propeller protein